MSRLPTIERAYAAHLLRRWERAAQVGEWRASDATVAWERVMLLGRKAAECEGCYYHGCAAQAHPGLVCACGCRYGALLRLA